MANKTSDTLPASDTPAKEDTPSPNLTLSSLSSPTPTTKRDPIVQKNGDTIRIDY